MVFLQSYINQVQVKFSKYEKKRHLDVFSSSKLKIRQGEKLEKLLKHVAKHNLINEKHFDFHEIL